MSPRSLAQPPDVAQEKSMPQAIAAPQLLARVRDIAEQANAPLSILFGLISLYYSRRSYQINREQVEAIKQAR
jgi:hypothetical protein